MRPNDEDLFRIQEALQRGEDVCPELAAPAIQLDRAGLTLNGRKITGAVPDSTNTDRLEPLRSELQDARETWRMVHPNQEFRPSVALDFGPGIAAAPGASVIRTAAVAGYPKQRVRSGALSLSLVFAFPEPKPKPRSDSKLLPMPKQNRDDPERHAGEFGRIYTSDGADEEPPPPVLKEELRLAFRATGVHLRFSGAATSRLGLDETLPGPQLAELLSRECPKAGGACFDRLIFEVGDGTFEAMFELIERVVKLATPSALPVAIGFESPAPSGPKDAAAQAPLADAGQLERGKVKPLKVRFGALSAQGPLAVETIRTVLAANEPAFRACYEQGLPRNPQLEGRVQVRFTIARDGSVWFVANAGSDLGDSSTVACVVRAVGHMHFPPPQGGTVKVVSPLMFSPPSPGSSR